MMETLFLSILNMSLTASFAILLVMIARIPLKKAPKTISYALWSVVAFRLVCPVSFESIFSLFPSKTTQVSRTITHRQAIMAVSRTAASSVSSAAPAPAMTPAASDPTQTVILVCSYLWAAGVAAMLIYSIVSSIILKRQLESAQHKRFNIYETDNLRTPFVFGILHPKIYIPGGLATEEKSYIIRHEQAHIHRLDYLVKPAAFLILSVHWFNPLVWAAFILMGNDMELSCDEKVLREMGNGIKKAYSSSLLSLSSESHILNGSPLAFGEGNVKSRIKNVLNYKRPAFWVIAVAVLAAVCIGFGLTCNPVSGFSKAASSKSDNFAKEIYQYRTPYCGDNSKVANIAQRLPVPETLTYDRIELTTREKPYSVEIKYRAAPKTIKYYSESLHRMPFDRNAALMFSLVGNMENITFKLEYTLEDGKTQKECPLSYTRQQANDLLEENVWESCGTLDSFSQFYGKLNQTLKKKYQDLEEKEKTQSASASSAEKSSDVKELKPTVPKWSPDQIIGTDMAELDYASEHTIIFHGSFGLYVYDLDSSKIIRSLDLKPIGCNMTQGDSCCIVTVSENGNTVSMHPSDKKEMYVYTVSSNKLVQTAYKESQDMFSNFEQLSGAGAGTGCFSANAVEIQSSPECQYGYLYTSDDTLGTLVYQCGKKTYPLFSIDGKTVVTSAPVPTEIQARIFTTKETDLLKIGKAGITHFYSCFMGKDIPKADRITSFKITDIDLESGGEKEFYVGISYDLTTSGDYFFNCNGTFIPYDKNNDGSGGKWQSCFEKYDIRSLGNSRYQIIPEGTEGIGGDLEPRYTDFDAASGRITLANGKQATIQLHTENAKEFDAAYAGAPGGGIYDLNFQGNYQIKVLDSAEKVLTETDFKTDDGQPANFSGEFSLQFDDYNRDGNPDFTIGQWFTSTNFNYQMYTVLPDGKVKRIDSGSILNLSHDFSVKFEKDKSTGFYAKVFDNSNGTTEQVHYSWNAAKDCFMKG